MATQEDKNHHGFRCAFFDKEDGCDATFATRGALIKHYRDSDEHHYCEKCDVPCKDWEALLDHKVKSPDHYCCPICGIDIKSGRSGLDLHHKQSHPRVQEITCQACRKKFGKAGAYMAHFHGHQCTKVTSVEVANQTQRKVIFDKILTNEDSGLFTGGSHADSTAGESEVTSSYRGSSSRNYSAAQNDLLTPSEANSKDSNFPPLGTNTPVTRSVHANGHSQNGSVAELTSMTRTQSLTDRDAEDDTKSNISSATSTARGSEVEFNRRPSTVASAISWPSSNELQSNPNPSMFAAGLDERNEEFDRTTGQRIHPNIDSRTSTTGSARRNPVMSGQYWNPDSPGFDAERYYNAVLGMYDCPFPDCRFTCQYPTLLRDHLRLSGDHSIKKWTCPQCRRIFKSQPGLISHMEDTFQRCNVRHRRDYMALMAKLSGGYVDASTAEREGEYKYESVRPSTYW